MWVSLNQAMHLSVIFGLKCNLVWQVLFLFCLNMADVEGVVSSKKKSNTKLKEKQTHGVQQLTVRTVLAQVQTSASFDFHLIQKGTFYFVVFVIIPNYSSSTDLHLALEE